jgi:peptidoglycan/xylan/chitin deacetylase (PgdA/CDA1 family)
MNAWQWGALAATIATLAWLTIRYSLFIPPIPGLPILMYHQVSLARRDALTVTRDQFESHLQYLSQAGYRSITCRELVEHLDQGSALPSRPVLITFDDGYLNNLEHAYPLLQRYGFCATMFLPVGWLGRTNGWDDGSEAIAAAGQLAALDPTIMEFGLHSHSHENYQHKTAHEIGSDTRRSLAELEQQGLVAAPALAYPYGKYPRDSAALAAMAEELVATGVRCGLRIGNRINRLPIRRRWEMRRINMKGTDTLWEFRVKVRKGRVKLF